MTTPEKKNPSSLDVNYDVMSGTGAAGLIMEQIHIR